MQIVYKMLFFLEEEEEEQEEEENKEEEEKGGEDPCSDNLLKVNVFSPTLISSSSHLSLTWQ